MNLYWAEFKSVGDETFRLDTRIYLSETNEPSKGDVCVGAIVGKNPGSARATTSRGTLQPINLNRDNLLPTVRNIVLKSYNNSRQNSPMSGYIQILNLFYLCNPDLKTAILAMQNCKGPRKCATESNKFPWVWYVWGGENTSLNQFKSRVSNLNSENHFFYDQRRQQVINRRPSESDFARHTQGLKHAFVVPYLTEIINKNG